MLLMCVTAGKMLEGSCSVLRSLKLARVLAAIISLSAIPAVGKADDGLAAIQRLMFLKGTWDCTVAGGSADSITQKVHYSFSPDHGWMTEVSDPSGPTAEDWATQLWGYDSKSGKIVAYNFARNGVTTKSVTGWVNGSFVSRRDDNGLLVVLKPVSADIVEWLVKRQDQTTLVREECKRSSIT